jgi:hypothetical protein
MLPMSPRPAQRVSEEDHGGLRPERNDSRAVFYDDASELPVCFILLKVTNSRSVSQ